MPEKDSISTFISEEGKKAFARWAFSIVAMLLLLAWTPMRDFVAAVIATPTKVEELYDRLDALDKKVTRVAGEDRIIQEELNLGFVHEPVYQGDVMVYTFIAKRTSRGESCIAESYTPVFTDMDNIALQGDAVIMKRQLLTASSSLVRLRLQTPPDLLPGRNTVRVSFEYNCNGQKVYDSTIPVAFRLLERAQGAK